MPLVAHAAKSCPSSNGTTTFTPQNPVQTSFAQELIAYWLSFARAGDPNTYKLERSPAWPSYTASKKARIVLQQNRENNSQSSGSYIELEPEVESKRCQFVASKVDHEQN